MICVSEKDKMRDNIEFDKCKHRRALDSYCIRNYCIKRHELTIRRHNITILHLYIHMTQLVDNLF